MGGIAGFVLPVEAYGCARAEDHEQLRRMLGAIHHRGPRGNRALVGGGIALGHATRSASGLRHDERTGVAVALSGDLTNSKDVRRRLEGKYRLDEGTDVDVLLASYLEWGGECVERLHGQFSFVIHDERDGSLWLARDRLGISPLFYSGAGGSFVFASEVKAILAAGTVVPSLDARALFETLHFWAPAAERTAFEGVASIPPGCIAQRRGSDLNIRRYWELDVSDERIDRGLSFEQATDELHGLLEEAVRDRLGGEQPVAAYLSGGLDSSLICAIAQRLLGGELRTFSVAFARNRYDESEFQQSVARELGTSHGVALLQDHEIGELLPEVVAHAECPMLRTAPAPLLKLSGLTRAHGAAAVLSGEGADEFFWGYDLFKETSVRQFWARQPGSELRPMLFRRLYPYLAISRQSPQLIRQFFGLGLGEPDALDFSHRIRWTNSGRIKRFLSKSFMERLAGWDPVQALLESLPESFHSLRPLARAQSLEVRTLLSQYLLPYQGERMLSANGLVGRFPFLDHRVIDFAARLPDAFKLRGLREKIILREVGKEQVPLPVLSRQKFPYRAPIAEGLVGNGAPEWARALLCADEVDRVGVFDGTNVSRLIEKLAARKGPPSDADDMALAAITTTQLLSSRFIRTQPVPRAAGGDVEVEYLAP